ncbi:MAG: Zn-dependent alcohol dehydrogenase [Caldilineaceae bacterium]|nr:Zn-dependent alcohol dehydrogenase [Caldilineaceae bacterium]
MKIKAAVVRQVGVVAIEDVMLDPPKETEMLVRMQAAGVCHSDLGSVKGEMRATPPLVLGHEGAGIVEAVGGSVTRFKPGDRVMINWLPGCGGCPTCLDGQPNLCERLTTTTFRDLPVEGTSRLHTHDGVTLKHMLSSATMAEYAIVNEDGAIPLLDGVPFEVGAIIGCAVITGVGAVMNTAQPKAGSSAAVIGCGGVGLNVIQGCVLAGCYPVIAVDTVDAKLEFARQMGATHTVNARQTDAIEAMQALTHRGPDYVFDAVGASATLRQALQAARPGGAAVLVGMFDVKQEVPIVPGWIVSQNKRLLGSFAGSVRPHVDLPKLQKLYLAGKLKLDELISKRYPLAGLPQAFEDMEAGRVARGVLVFEE